MRKIILYVAMSLDGKVAKADGSVDWLHELPNPNQEDHGYAAFYASVDTTIMGNTTYQQIRGFDLPFPYADTTNYVFTRQENLVSDEYVTFVKRAPTELVRKLKEQKGKNIWLVGGGEMVSLFLQEGLIDELQIFVMPIILGEGIPLFGAHLAQQWLSLKGTRHFNTGAVEMIYNLTHD